MESAADDAAGERGRRAAAGAEGKHQVTQPQRRCRSAPPGKRLQELTPRERRMAEVLLFMWQAIADAEAYIAMTEDEVEEEYRRAGKLHRYDPDKEWQKRLARVARRWPPPEGLIPEIGEYLRFLEEDEQDDGVDQSGQQKNYIDQSSDQENN